MTGILGKKGLLPVRGAWDSNGRMHFGRFGRHRLVVLWMGLDY